MGAVPTAFLATLPTQPCVHPPIVILPNREHRGKMTRQCLQQGLRRSGRVASRKLGGPWDEAHEQKALTFFKWQDLKGWQATGQHLSQYLAAAAGNFPHCPRLSLFPHCPRLSLSGSMHRLRNRTEDDGWKLAPCKLSQSLASTKSSIRPGTQAAGRTFSISASSIGTSALLEDAEGHPKGVQHPPFLVVPKQQLGCRGH